MKMLIVRFSSIGDIVLTSPVIRGLKEQLGAELHYLTKKAYQPIVEANPHVSRVYTLGDDFSALLSALKAEEYDYIIDLHRNLRTLRIKASLNKKNYTFPKLNVEKWLMVNFKWDRLPDQHIVHRYLEAVAPLGVSYDGKGLDYFIPEEDEVVMSNFLTGNVLQAEKQAPEYVALVIGAAHATKRMTEEKLIAICQGITKPIVLLGGPAESEQGQRIAAAGGGHVFNSCGLFSLNQSASVVQQASTVITHDTGMMHIAAAFSKPIVSVWGNTIPAFGMYPFYPDGIDRSTIIEVEGLACRPCSKIGYDKCPKGHFRCMEDIAVAQIVACSV
jgi:ADP-heptose:LPS heptosyltransferase